MNFGKIALSGKLSRASMVRMLWIAVLLQCLVAAFSVEVLAAPSGVNNDNITPLDQAEQARAMKLCKPNFLSFNLEIFSKRWIQ
jgi:hypothetical protein